jgi:poly(hydroxyalkanoate) granule-associated protein
MNKPKPKAQAKAAKPKLKPVAKPASKPVLKPKLKASAKAAPPPAAKAAPTLKSAAAAKSKPVPNKTIMESAQHIWLAGLGAFAKAQEEGGKLFEALVKEGSTLEQKTRKIATGTVGDVRGAVESSVTQVRERTQETWDKLEQVFETRVSRALGKLNVPGRKDLDDLLKRVDELGQQVRKLTGNARASIGQVLGGTVRRARDDLSDLARELEEVQLAAKSSATKRPAPKTRKPAR